MWSEPPGGRSIVGPLGQLLALGQSTLAILLPRLEDCNM